MEQLEHKVGFRTEEQLFPYLFPIRQLILLLLPIHFQFSTIRFQSPISAHNQPKSLQFVFHFMNQFLCVVTGKFQAFGVPFLSISLAGFCFQNHFSHVQSSFRIVLLDLWSICYSDKFEGESWDWEREEYPTSKEVVKVMID